MTAKLIFLLNDFKRQAGAKATPKAGTGHSFPELIRALPPAHMIRFRVVTAHALYCRLILRRSLKYDS